MSLITNFVRIIVIAAILILGYLNMQIVEFRYFFTTPSIKVPLIVIFLGGIFIGALLAGLLSFTQKYRLKREISQLNKRIKTAEDEVHRLRNLPLSQNQNLPK